MHVTPPPNWGAPAPERTPRARIKLIIVAVASSLVMLVVLVPVVAAVVVLEFVLIWIAPSPATFTSRESDEIEVLDVAYAIERAINDADYDAFSALVCRQVMADPRFDERAFQQSSAAYRELPGDLLLTVESVVIHGDTASADITPPAGPAYEAHFVREDGCWTWCGDPARLLPPH